MQWNRLGKRGDITPSSHLGLPPLSVERMMLPSRIRVILLACCALMLGSAGAARADTMTCLDGGSGYCSLGSGNGGTGDYGAITYTGVGTNTLDITFTLAVGVIADPPPNPTQDASVVFDVIGATSASILSGTGWSFPGVNGKFGIDADETSNPPFGIFNAGASCNFSSGCGTSVEIQVKGSDLTFGTTTSSAGTFSAAIDTQNTVAGQFCIPGTDFCFPTFNTVNGAVAENLAQTPLPAALPLFATALGAGFLGLRKRRKSASAITA
jgi:hypothetical protein